MEFGDAEFMKEFLGLLDNRIRKIIREEVPRLKNEAVGRVAATTSGATAQVYINNSATAVTVKNSRGLSLTTNQLVYIRYPNFKDDQAKFIDRPV